MDKVSFEAKTTWIMDDIVMPEDSNRWEQGIKDCADGVNAIIDELPALPYLPTSGGTVNGNITANKFISNLSGSGFEMAQAESGLNVISNIHQNTEIRTLGVLRKATGLTNDKKFEILDASMKAVPNGVASLGSDGKLPPEQLPENYDFVVESYTDDSGNWYRVYKSGWVEQGGGAYTRNAITFLKPYEKLFGLTSSPVGGNDTVLSFISITETGFNTTGRNTGGSDSNFYYYWKAFGQGAE